MTAAEKLKLMGDALEICDECNGSGESSSGPHGEGSCRKCRGEGEVGRE